MSADPRPNLGGLFNGSTPPEKSSSISAAFGPRFLKQLPVDEQARDLPPEPDRGPAPSGAPAAAADAEPPAGPGNPSDVRSWIDPTRIVEQYFAFLQAVLDTNRQWAVALTSTVMSLPKRRRTR